MTQEPGEQKQHRGGINTSTWAEQFRTAYLVARAGHAQAVQEALDANRTRLADLPEAAEGIRAVECGLNAQSIGMTLADAMAWAERIKEPCRNEKRELA